MATTIRLNNCSKLVQELTTLFRHKMKRAPFTDLQNYNKSRIHSYRGAKDVEILVDGQSVFKGEIERACGGVMAGSEAYGDVSTS